MCKPSVAHSRFLEPHPLNWCLVLVKVKGRVRGVSLSNHHMIVEIMSTHQKKRFFAACEAGDVEQIRKLIADGVKPKTIKLDFLKETPLHAACRYHHL